MGRTHYRTPSPPGAPGAISNKHRRFSIYKDASKQPRKIKMQKPISPETRKNGTAKHVKRGSKRCAFVERVHELVRLGKFPDIESAATVHRIATGTRKRDSDRWLIRYVEAGDIRKLMDNRKGQGRPSAWTKDNKKTLRAYLKKQPKPGVKGRCQWPSNERASKKAASGKLDLPIQTARNLCYVARSLNLKHATVVVKCLLTQAMRNRRVAFAKEWLKKPESFWKNVLFADEGGEDSYIHAPRAVWQEADGSDPVHGWKVKGSDRLNFFVGGGRGVKLPLYTYKGGLDANRFKDICKKVLIPIFKKHANFTHICLDGDKCHIGMGRQQSLAVNEFWRNDPVLKKIKLITGPDRWDKDTGELRSADAQAHALRLGRNKVPGATSFRTWPANSPDLNISEHQVAAIKQPADWAPGSYSIKELESGMHAQNKAYGQSSINGAVLSMRKRLQGVIRVEGWTLAHSDY